MRNLCLISLFALLLSAPAFAGPALTIYSHDLGLVRERRTIELTGSRDTLRFSDLPERLDFSSLRLVPPGSARVTRLAYRWDVASGDGLIDAARGRRVKVTSRGDRAHEGTLVSSDGTWLVLRGDDGAITTLSRVAVEEVRLADAPGSLSLRPTLEAAIEGGTRGRGEADLSYLTGGLSWDAEHVLVRRGEREGKWSASVTIENSTGRAFTDADLQLIAGEPQRVGGAPPIVPVRAMMKMSADAGAAPDLSEQAFSEYHLYTLGRPATLRDRESQSFSMIEPHAVRLTPRYVYRGGDARGVMAQLEMMNTRDAGPGVPLPAGRVRVYQSDPSGGLQFIGENRIRHTAAGEKLTLDVGVAFDLAAERRETSQRRISDREREYSIEIKLRNRKSSDVTIVCEEPVSGDVDVTAKSQEFTRKDSNTLVFTVPVAAGKEAVVTYTAHARY